MKAICVFCGSNVGRRAIYAETARALAGEIAGRGLTLVYGGASVGLMGIMADAALEAGGEVVGVIPQSLVDREIAHAGLSAREIVPSMHARKARMADLADGFVALPGGVGTLEEIFEVWTWGQLGDHQKPVGFLNAGGFFDRLVGFLDLQTAEGFMHQAHRDMVVVEADPARLLDRFASYRAPAVKKWIDAEER